MLDGLGRIQLGPQQQLECFLDLFNALRRVPAPLESDSIHAEAARFAFRHHDAERRHVLRDHREAADVRVPADAAKLMHRAVRAHVRVILHRHVAGQRSAVGENCVIAHLTIVRHVRIHHE